MQTRKQLQAQVTQLRSQLDSHETRKALNRYVRDAGKAMREAEGRIAAFAADKETLLKELAAARSNVEWKDFVALLGDNPELSDSDRVELFETGSVTLKLRGGREIVVSLTIREEK